MSHVLTADFVRRPGTAGAAVESIDRGVLSVLPIGRLWCTLRLGRVALMADFSSVLERSRCLLVFSASCSSYLVSRSSLRL